MFYEKVFSIFAFHSYQQLFLRKSFPVTISLQPLLGSSTGLRSFSFSSSWITEAFFTDFLSDATRVINHPIRAQSHRHDCLPLRQMDRDLKWYLQPEDVFSALELLDLISRTWKRVLSCVEEWRGCCVPEYAKLFHKLPDFLSLGEQWLEIVRYSDFLVQQSFVFENVAPYFMWFLSSFNLCSRLPFWLGVPILFVKTQEFQEALLLTELQDLTGLSFEADTLPDFECESTSAFFCQEASNFIEGLFNLGQPVPHWPSSTYKERQPTLHLNAVLQYYSP